MEARKQANAEITSAVVEFATSEEFEYGQERYNALMLRSALDSELRRKLLENPMEGLAEFYGHEVPEAFGYLDIRFIENRGDITIVLPDPVLAEHELTEEDLQSVAGGNPAISAAVSATGSPASAVVSAIVSGGFALAAIWLATK